jgi:hypothetical protein
MYRKYLTSVLVAASILATASTADAHIFCYNKYSGRFIHWGYCDNVPRVYCHIGPRFLHWGACY